MIIKQWSDIVNCVLEVRHLTVRFRVEGKSYPVIEDLNFVLKKGETLALVGESGCGKSVTAHCLMGILPKPPALPPEGEILYQGENLLKLSENDMRRLRGRHLSMVFQDPIASFNPVFPIGDQLLEALAAHREIEDGAGKEAVIEALTEVHMPRPQEVLSLYPHQLSGGMLQRAMIAMALIASPQILIADEPTTALDVTMQAQILSLLKELQEKRGMAVLLITHDMGVVAQNADKVIVMYAGRAVESGSVDTLFDYPSHPYTQALFASRPQPHMRKKKLAAIPGFVPRLHHMPQGCPFNPRCSYAMDLCKKGEVPLFPLKQKEHAAKCWLYDKDLDAKISTALEPMIDE